MADTEPREYGHVAVMPPRIGPPGPALPAAWADVPDGLTVADVVDVVGPLYLMSPVVRALWPVPRPLVGRAVTVKAWPGDNLAIHAGLAIAGPGDVVVVDWRSHVGSCGAGARIMREAHSRGVHGIVIDGALRDVAELAELGIPAFGVAECPYSPGKRHAGEIDVPVACGGVVVQPGDIVFADLGGVAIVPAAHASDIGTALAASRAAPPRYSTAAERLATYARALAAAGGQDSHGRIEIGRPPVQR